MGWRRYECLPRDTRHAGFLVLSLPAILAAAHTFLSLSDSNVPEAGRISATRVSMSAMRVHKGQRISHPSCN